MIEIKKKVEQLTVWEKKEKRRKYMREYYLKRKYQMREGRFYKDVKKKPIENKFTISRGIFWVCFD